MNRIDLSEDLTIIRGDCLDVLPVDCDAVVTDPPYGISVKGAANKSPNGTRNLDFFPGDDDWAAMAQLAESALSVAIHANPHTVVSWCGHRQVGLITAALENAGYSTRMLFWIKKCPAPTAPGAGFTSAVEMAVYAYTQERAWHGSQYEHNFYRADSYRHGQPGKVDHPTQKPCGLIAWNVRLLTDKGQVVLDPFMGSGTTGIACIRTGRRFIGIELDEHYFNVAHDRLKRELAQGRLALDFDPPEE